MLCLDGRLGLLEKAHVLEGEREQGDGGDSDEEGEEILIHDEARIESAEERHDAADDNDNLEDKDDNAIILAKKNMSMAVDPRMIPGDQRDGYYVKVMDWTTWYAIKGKYNTCYGYAFQNPVIQEFVRLHGVHALDGVKGSSHGAIYRLWQNGAKYDDMVAKSMNYTRWFQVKQTYTLNLNATATKRGHPG
jgi:hypothetical protein